jgi:hypothetical protein
MTETPDRLTPLAVTNTSSPGGRASTRALTPFLNSAACPLHPARILLMQASGGSLSSSGGEEAHCSYRGLGPEWHSRQMLILSTEPGGSEPRPPAPEPRFARESPTILPLPFRRGEGRGEGSVLGFRDARRVRRSEGSLPGPLLPRRRGNRRRSRWRPKCV